MFHVEPEGATIKETHMMIDVNNRESFRSNSVIRTEIDREARKLTFHVFKQGSLVLDLSRVSRSNLDFVAFHGFKQRIGDAAAIERSGVGTTAQSASPAEKFAAMRQLVDHYNSGAESWRLAQAEPGEGTLLFQALMRQKPDRDEAHVRKVILEWPRAKREAMLIDPQLKPFVDAIRAEHASGIDTSEAFAELDAM